jgi:cardiolipin synthase (CMP-forming)
MKTFAAADLGLLPNVVSLTRLPLAAAFPFVVDRPALAGAVLGAAGLSDVLDGWLARRSKQTTVAGAIIDPIADKVFAITVMLTLLDRGKLPVWGVPALLAREIVETPLVLWVLLHPARRSARVAEARANAPGKLATLIQLAAVTSAIAFPKVLPHLLVLAGAAGCVAGVGYWAREVRASTPAK